jgi:hypothetical protein
MAHLLIGHGAIVEPEHAASLGLLDELQRMIAKDSEILKRPKVIKGFVGGAAFNESPLKAAKRRGRAAVVPFLLEHGAADLPEFIIQ